MFDKNTISELQQYISGCEDKTPQLLEDILKEYNIFNVSNHEYNNTDFKITKRYDQSYDIEPLGFHCGYRGFITMSVKTNKNSIGLDFNGGYDESNSFFKIDQFKLKVINNLINLIENDKRFKVRVIEMIQQQQSNNDRAGDLYKLINSFTYQIEQFKKNCIIDDIYKTKSAKLGENVGIWACAGNKQGDSYVNELSFSRNPSGTYTIRLSHNNEVKSSTDRGSENNVYELVDRFANGLVEKD